MNVREDTTLILNKIDECRKENKKDIIESKNETKRDISEFRKEARVEMEKVQDELKNNTAIQISQGKDIEILKNSDLTNKEDINEIKNKVQKLNENAFKKTVIFTVVWTLLIICSQIFLK